MGLGIGQADAYINDLGPTVASLRKLLTIEYSKRPTYGLPFKNLGDAYSNKPTIQTDVVSEIVNDYGLTKQRNIELPFRFIKDPNISVSYFNGIEVNLFNIEL